MAEEVRPPRVFGFTGTSGWPLSPSLASTTSLAASLP